MKHTAILAIDAAINIVLGLLMIVFPRPLVSTLGVPSSVSAFYPSMLGGILLGIGIALVIQIARQDRPQGLGLGGAVAINLCGGILLAAWLLWGDLDIPPRGHVFLWSLVAILVGISLVELKLQETRTRG